MAYICLHNTEHFSYWQNHLKACTGGLQLGQAGRIDDLIMVMLCRKQAPAAMVSEVITWQ